MCSCLCFSQIELSSPCDYYPLVFEVLIYNLNQLENLRLPIDKCKHNHAVCRLQLRVFVQPVENYVRIYILLKLDDDSHAFTVGFVAYCRDTFNLFVSNQVCHGLDESGLVDLKRNLSDDNSHLAASCFLYFTLRSDRDLSCSGLISLLGSLSSENHGSGRKIRCFNNLY